MNAAGDPTNSLWRVWDAVIVLCGILDAACEFLPNNKIISTKTVGVIFHEKSESCNSFKKKI